MLSPQSKIRDLADHAGLSLPPVLSKVHIKLLLESSSHSLSNTLSAVRPTKWDAKVVGSTRPSIGQCKTIWSWNPSTNIHQVLRALMAHAYQVEWLSPVSNAQITELSLQTILTDWSKVLISDQFQSLLKLIKLFSNTIAVAFSTLLLVVPLLTTQFSPSDTEQNQA